MKIYHGSTFIVQNLINQISFHTEKALNSIKYLEKQEVSDDE